MWFTISANASPAQLPHKHPAVRGHVDRQSMWPDHFHCWQTKTIAPHRSAEPMSGLVARFHSDAPKRRLLWSFVHNSGSRPGKLRFITARTIVLTIDQTSCPSFPIAQQCHRTSAQVYALRQLFDEGHPTSCGQLSGHLLLPIARNRVVYAGQHPQQHPGITRIPSTGWIRFTHL